MARPARRSGNLPAETASFVGRRRELAEVRTKLTEARLISLVGPGVARLVADGLTNRQLGARLFISERTVDSHVRSILNKLGFGSRAQIAAWVAGPDV
jgi:DNA-binding NarL/FixJ family response regulator